MEEELTAPLTGVGAEAADRLRQANLACLKGPLVSAPPSLHATEKLEQIAETLGAPIIKALLGKVAVPDDSPYTTGGIGLLGTKPLRRRSRSATRC